MDRKQQFFRSLTDKMDLKGESLPGLSVAEVWGSGRVLVENHRGVMGYSEDMVLIRVSYGSLEIHGKQLELTCMSDEQLIITGEIRELKLTGR